MKLLVKTILLIMLPFLSFGQEYAFYRGPEQNDVDSAQRAFKDNINDTARMAACHELAFYFADFKIDSSFYFSNQQLVLARKLGFKLWEADALDFSGYVLWRLGNYPEALQRFLKGIRIAEDPASEGAEWGLARFDTK